MPDSNAALTEQIRRIAHATLHGDSVLRNQGVWQAVDDEITVVSTQEVPISSVTNKGPFVGIASDHRRNPVLPREVAAIASAGMITRNRPDYPARRLLGSRNLRRIG